MQPHAYLCSTRSEARGGTPAYEAGGQPDRGVGVLRHPAPGPGVGPGSALNTPATLCPARRHQALVVRGGGTFVKSRLLPRRLLQLRCAGIPSPRMCPPLPTAWMWS